MVVDSMVRCLQSTWSQFKPTHASLLYSWKDTLRHFPLLGKQFLITVISLLKLQANSNILAFPEAGQGNYLLYVFAPLWLSCKSGE